LILQSRTNTTIIYGKDFSSPLQYLEIFLKSYLPKHQMMRWRVNKFVRLTYLSAPKGVIQQPILLQMDQKILELDSSIILDFIFSETDIIQNKVK
jgi:hypothetical protein